MEPVDSRAEILEWAIKEAFCGHEGPLEFLSRFEALETTSSRARRLISLLDRPGWRDQEPRVDRLLERLSDRRDILERRLARTARAAWGKTPPHRLFMFIVGNESTANLVSAAEATLRNESVRRNLARHRRVLRAKAPAP